MTWIEIRCSAQSDKYIYIDGCRNAGDEEKQKAVVDIAKDSMATVIVSDHNKGLGNSIISGVSDVIARYGKVIVLEDDLRLMQGFLAYMNQALDMYEPDKAHNFGVRLRFENQAACRL